MPLTEADVCHTFVVPKLWTAGWDTPPHAINAQRASAGGRIYFAGRMVRRDRQKHKDET